MIIQGLKYRWRLPQLDEAEAVKLAGSLNISVPVIHTLLARGYTTREAIEQFVFSDKERDVAHPSLLKDATKAIDRIIQAIERKEKILIAGDYDVDGITSSALMLMCLLPLGADINFFLPNRVRDGYGLSVKTITRAAQNGYTVVITVDNGITAFEPAREAKKVGIDLIITDHHRPHAELPDAYAIVDPYQSDCPYPFKGFAGVGVSFKLMTLLYERLGRELPPKIYELMLLGTIADVVPLKDENRYWVRHGLQLVNKHESVSLRVLKESARVTKPVIKSLDVGFFLTPQINALGRLDDARDGVKFLIGANYEETARIGSVLAQFNEARKTIERDIYAQVEAQIVSGAIDLTRDRVIMAASSNWPSGVIGLVASRLVSAYHRPVILFHLTPEGIAKGSCRSIAAFSMFKALSEVHDLLNAFGGHAAAAGLSLPTERLPELKKRLQEIVDRELTPEDFLPTLHLDGQLMLHEASSKLMRDLGFLEPFGCENSAPLFCVRGAVIVGQPTIMKEVHVKCALFYDGMVKNVVFFNRPDIIAKLKEYQGEPCDVAVQVTENHWRDEVKIELTGMDIAL